MVFGPLVSLSHEYDRVTCRKGRHSSYASRDVFRRQSLDNYYVSRAGGYDSYRAARDSLREFLETRSEYRFVFASRRSRAVYTNVASP